jgi:DNA-directed RNA polymerase specialized sigma24 family protein
VLGIAKGVAAKHAQRRRHRRGEPLTDELVKTLLDLATGPCAVCEASDERGQIHAAVEQLAARLSPLNRRILVLRVSQDVALTDITKLTGLSLGAVKQRLHTIYQRLRDELRRRGIGTAQQISVKISDFT